MRTRTILLVFAMCLTAAVCFGADNTLGTWKLNEAKSKIPAGAGKNTTVVYTAEGNKTRCVVDGVDGAGKPVHNEWVGMFDGKQYPLTGDDTADSRVYKKLDARHYEFWNMKKGKAVVSGSIVYTADGKSRTVTTTYTDAMGNKLKSVQHYDKQ